MNCIVVDDDRMSRLVIEEFIKKTNFLSLIASFSTAVEAINAITSNNQINLIFLDIEMPEMNGIDFMNTLKQPPQIIIISSKEKYALDAFSYDVTDYLLKPIAYPRFYRAVSKANSRYQLSRLDNHVREEIFIKKGSSLVRLKLDDILWVEALENYVILNTFNEKYTIHFTMKAIERKLPPAKFIRIHRSYIININKIAIIQDNLVEIETDHGLKGIPIGKSYKEQLMKDINLMVK
ncbi:MAG TPA: response regulator transcription factor [Bacteroidetes bacterium]|nr:response regulator transcription factor [Bacteroidota bacterium]